MTQAKSLALAALVAGLVAIFTACGGYAPPTGKVASSEAAIRAADEMGADDHPQAALHLKLARDQHEAAKALIDEGNNERADYVLQRAQADAELARSLAHEAKMQADASEVLEQVKELREQTK